MERKICMPAKIVQSESELQISDLKKNKLIFDKAMFGFMIWNEDRIIFNFVSFSKFNLKISVKLNFYYKKAKNSIKRKHGIPIEPLKIQGNTFFLIDIEIRL